MTAVGQQGIMFISKKINDYFRKVTGNYGHNFISYGDTDSAFLNMEPLVNMMFKDKPEATEMDKTKFLVRLFLEKIEPLLLQWADELSKSLNCTKNYLQFKLEKIAVNSIFGDKKKRYCMGLNYKEGTFYEEPKLLITGFEAIRSTYKKQWRDWMKETYKIALYGKEEDVHKKVAEIESTFRKLPVHEIGTVTSVNDIEKYSIDRFTAGKGAPKQVKAAINYNKLKYHYKMGGLDIQSGDKIQYVGLVKNNPYGIEVIGYPEYLPEEFGLTKYIDYGNIFDKNYLDPMTNFLRAINWSPKKRANAMSLFC